jgi:hypothetical protein
MFCAGGLAEEGIDPGTVIVVHGVAQAEQFNTSPSQQRHAPPRHPKRHGRGYAAIAGADGSRGWAFRRALEGSPYCSATPVCTRGPSPAIDKWTLAARRGAKDRGLGDLWPGGGPTFGGKYGVSPRATFAH